MARHYKDWITGFLDYTSYMESPTFFYFWTAVSTIAGALQRKVWIDQVYFKWYPNFYIIFDGPPGIVAKTTTLDVGMDLLREVPGVNFGPKVVTWQSLVTKFNEFYQEYDNGKGEYIPMSAMTLASGEFGNLLDPKNRDMVDLFVTLWDCPNLFDKSTKSSGSDVLSNIFLNLGACTTPSWIAGHFPEYMIGGGFTSRCLFVYADEKAKLNAYIKRTVPKGIEQQREKLLLDLIEISKIIGEFTLTEEAMDWGELWYKNHYAVRPMNLDDERFGGYLARKQANVHKLAMVLKASDASSDDNRLILPEHLEIAANMITDLEPDMAMVFSKIGKGETSVAVDRLVAFILKRGGCWYDEAYRYVHSHFVKFRDFDDALTGCVRSGQLLVVPRDGKQWIAPGVFPQGTDGRGTVSDRG